LQPDDKPRVNVDGIEELVADKGYHSGAVVLACPIFCTSEIVSVAQRVV
jgi:uncharacterized membrane protein